MRGSTVFATVIRVLLTSPFPFQCFRNEDADNVLSVLYVLSQSSRFKLSVDFLSRQEKHLVSIYMTGSPLILC